MKNDTNQSIPLFQLDSIFSQTKAFAIQPFETDRHEGDNTRRLIKKKFNGKEKKENDRKTYIQFLLLPIEHIKSVQSQSNDFQSILVQLR